jgi:xanthosine phosphorylase
MAEGWPRRALGRRSGTDSGIDRVAPPVHDNGLSATARRSRSAKEYPIMPDLDAPFAAADIIRRRAGAAAPRFALILGSGLGRLADLIENAVTLPYAELPGFPIATVEGHAGQLVLGRLAGVAVACLCGRSHFYEGKGLDTMTAAIRALKLAGIETLLLTNAAGSLRPEIGPGRLVAITDHINLLPGTPLIGANDARFGPRFFSLANAYDADRRRQLQVTAQALGIALEEGVYLACPGPCFETPAEIRMMRTLGADLVGMSTVPEVIAARHCGLEIIAVSVVTNLAEGLSDTVLSHEHTMQHAAIGAVDLQKLILGFLARQHEHNPTGAPTRAHGP